MESNNPIHAWVPPQINEIKAVCTTNYQDIQDGVNKGYQEGLLKAEQEYQGQLVKATQLIHGLDKLKMDLTHDAQSQLSEIVMIVAKKIIEHELTINKTQIEKILREMLNKISDKNEAIKIIVHPDDLDTVKKITTNETEKTVDITIDPSLTVGSLKLKSDCTSLEYNIETIFNSIVEVVKNGAQ